MPSFSKLSAAKLATCHPDLQRLFNKVVQTFDCTVLEGHRGEAAQNAAFKAGKSKLKFPEGKHNKFPSLAADVVPYPLDWEDREKFSLFAGFVLGTAVEMGIKIRWGGSWDNSLDLKKNKFDDLPHYEILG